MRRGPARARLVRRRARHRRRRGCGSSAIAAARRGEPRGRRAATSSRSTPPRWSRPRSRPSSSPATTPARATRVRAFEWFLGPQPAAALPVYDFSTGGCHDGLGATGRQRQRGRRVDARLPAGAARARRRRPPGDAARMKLALLGPIAWRTPPRALRPVGAGHRAAGRRPRAARRRRDAVRHAGLDHARASSTASASAPTRRTATLDGRVWEALHVAHALSRSAEFDLIHNHLDWLPLALSGARRGADGDDDPRVLLARGSCPPTSARRSAFVSISDSDRVARARLRRDRPPRRRHDRAAVLRARPATGSSASAASTPTRAPRRRSRSPARAERPLVLCGPVQDERYFAEEVEPHIDGDRVRYLGSVGPRRARRGPRRGRAACCTRSRSPSRSGSRSSSRCCAARRSSPTPAGRCRSSSRTASPACSSHDVDSAVARRRARRRASTAPPAARRAERRFSADRMVDDYLAVYERRPP